MTCSKQHFKMNLAAVIQKGLEEAVIWQLCNSKGLGYGSHRGKGDGKVPETF